MSYNTIFASLAGSPATQPASLIDNMFNRVGQIAVVPCDCAGTNTLTLTPQANTPPITAYTNHTPIFSTILVATSTGLVTAQVGSLQSLPVYKMDAVTQLTLNDLRIGRLLQLVFESSLNGGAGGFIALQTLLPFASGAITGTSQVKTTSYTVTNNDKGSTITINNNSQFTVTGNAASGYDADFQVRIYNGNANAGIIVNFPGITLPTTPNTNCLYPGQSCVLQNISGTWSLVQQPGRWIKPAAIIFVNPNSGSDTANDGLTANTAMATIFGAYSLIASMLDTNGSTVTIQLAATTHSIPAAGITFAYPLVGKGALVILGDMTNLTTALSYSIIFNGSGFSARDLSTVICEGMSFSTNVAGTVFLSASNDATIDAETCVFFSAPSGGFGGAATNGTCNFLTPNRIVGNASFGFSASSGGYVSLGSPWTVDAGLTISTFATAGSCGVVDASNASFSGGGAGAGTTGTVYSVSSAGGIIHTSVLPGNSAGLLTAPGWTTA